MLYDSSYQDPILPPNDDHILQGGLTVFTAAIFITGEMAGTGLLALPKAMDQAGWYGLLSTLFLCVLSGYCGIKLGDCWTMVRKMNPLKYEDGNRSPFQVIATEGAGRPGNVSTSLSLPVQMMQTYMNRQTGVIFLILAASNVKSLFDVIGVKMHVCLWILVVALVMLGPCLLGTPKDSWPMAVGAMICTAVACVFILIGILAYHKKEDRDDPSPISFNSFSTSLGTMFFAWGGSAMFPTIQVDMRQPEKFHLAVFISYILLLLFYIPVSIVGFSIYGSNVADNILLNLPQNFFRYAVEILITGHLATAFTIVLNPVFQGFEEFTRIPKKFCWQRAVIRSTIVLFLAFMAETLPHFGPILSFIGGSTVSILGFILPTICFVTIKFQSTRLIDERFINNIFRVIPKLDIILLFLALVVGFYGAIASSYSSFFDLVSPATFVKPCWLDLSAADPSTKNNTVS